MVSNDFKLAVLVSGRGTNLQAIIDSIERGELPAKIAVILSDVKDAAALDRGKKHGIESVFLDPKSCSEKKEFDRAMIDLLKSRSVDLVCLAGFMRILGPEFIGTFRGRIVNIHPSLLPAFPGLHPQRQALDYGVKFSGCTAHLVDDQVDGGPIILQAAVPVHDDDDEDTLARRILEQEHILYPRAIRLVAENKLAVSGRTVVRKKEE
ncbi:MAG: phosphoribosylglycinamide formyltransferase [Nitrospinaceae bacterium]